MNSKFKIFLKNQLSIFLEGIIAACLLLLAMTIAYAISSKFGLVIEYKPSFRTLILGVCFLNLLMDQFKYRKKLKRLRKELES